MSDRFIAGRYRILKPLGSGAFGHTYLAEDTQMPNNLLCVVKQLKPKYTDKLTIETAKRLFPREAETLSKLGEHPQIPRLLAHMEEDNEFYLVQEYIEGSDLDKEIKPGIRLEESKVVKILDEILDTLTFVHQKKVIHRDIKPENIMRRDRDGKLVLIDFGAVKEIATQVSKAQKLTVAIGTHGYMPIEQQRGLPSCSSDVYALGMMAIFALTGIHPEQIPVDRKTEEVIWRDGININPKLANFINNMVRHNHGDRYPTATEALKALRKIDETPSIDGIDWFIRFKPYLITGSLLLFFSSFLFIKSSEIASLCSILNNCSQNIKLQEEYQRIVELATPTLTAIENSQSLSSLDWEQLTEYQNKIEKLIAELETIPQDARVYPQAEETIKDWNAQLNRLNREMEIEEPIW